MVSQSTRSAFRTPVRRKTRQRSGFNVAGNTPGSECKLKKTGRLDIDENTFERLFIKENASIPLLFKKSKGLICFGAYLKPSKTIELSLTLALNNENASTAKTVTVYANQWNKVGILKEINLTKPITETLCCKFEVRDSKKIGRIDFFGINLDSINYAYFKENDVESIFNEKTNIYVPEICYRNFDQIILAKSLVPIKSSEGEPIILKSCNRCSRFLPIDALSERNTLSFSNHCVEKAPCTHTAFSQYSIKESDYPIVPPQFQKQVSSGKVKLAYGYQLECKSCKKFFVNAPLNPLRNSTQHREDSLRRRAIEVLVDTLLERKWLYYKFRVEKEIEFDKHILEKFESKCFKCGKPLKNEHEMDLDHTMPLAAFWPLDETATCLCKKCNSQKSDKFPVEFYSPNELKRLSQITGCPLELLNKKEANIKVIKVLIEKVVWFFDEFLSNNEYQKIRKGKRTSDLIYKAIVKQIQAFYDKQIDLVSIYKDKTGRIPTSITVKNK